MRLALWYGLSLLILLTLFVVYLYTSFHVGLHRDFERQLHAEADAIEERMDLARVARSESESSGRSMQASALQASYGTFVRILRADGRVLRASSSFERRSSFAPRIQDRLQPTFRGHTWNGDLARSLYRPLTEGEASGQKPVWLEVTRLESSIHREMHRLGWLLALGIAMGVVLAIGTGYGLARRALRPVAALTDAARDIQDEPTGELPTDFGVRDELTDLAETFNAMLQRIRSAFTRERRFRADAAHKMFTPLTAIQNELDVTLRKPRSETTYRDALKSIRQHTTVLSDTLDELMTLSEIESTSAREQLSAVNWAVRVQAGVKAFRVRARRRSIRLQCDLVEPVWVAVPDAYIDTLVENLLDNALKYTPVGGHIHVSLRVEDGAGVLQVDDDGIGFSPTQSQRLFDRFYRSAEADATASGSGLGLSIVQAIAERYGGQVYATSDGVGTGSSFVVRLPGTDRTS